MKRIIKKRRKEVWHSWFAWCPIVIATHMQADHECATWIWLERVERKGEFMFDSQGGYYFYKYKKLSE